MAICEWNKFLISNFKNFRNVMDHLVNKNYIALHIQKEDRSLLAPSPVAGMWAL